MALLIQSEEIINRFLENFRDENGVNKYIMLLQNMITYQHNSITIDYKDLYTFNHNLAYNIQNKPGEYLKLFYVSVFRKLLNINFKTALKIKDFKIKVIGLTAIPIRSICSSHIGKLISIKGEIIQTSEFRPFITKAAFLCQCCRNMILLEQVASILESPSRCKLCGYEYFDFLPTKSKYTDSQSIVVRDLLRTHFSNKVQVKLTANNVNTCKLSDIVLITGILKIHKKMYNNVISREFKLILEATNVEIVDH